MRKNYKFKVGIVSQVPRPVEYISDIDFERPRKLSKLGWGEGLKLGRHLQVQDGYMSDYRDSCLPLLLILGTVISKVQPL